MPVVIAGAKIAAVAIQSGNADCCDRRVDEAVMASRFSRSQSATPVVAAKVALRQQLGCSFANTMLPKGVGRFHNLI